MKLCIVSVSPTLFHRAVTAAVETATGALSVHGLGNGVELPKVKDAQLTHLERNAGVSPGMHELWMRSRSPDPHELYCFIHDDVTIHERGWDERVRRVFLMDPRCGFVGFGGATAYGDPDIYKKPYALHHLNRQDFWSNMDAAERHGKRTTEARQIVYADSLALVMSEKFLNEIGGWSRFPFIHHGVGEFISCMARRHGYTAWLVPVSIRHGESGWGAGARENPVYKDLASQHGGDDAVHGAVHRFLYDEFRDVLPMQVP